MTFECKKVGSTQFGKWAYGKLTINAKVNIIGIYRVEVDLQANKTYEVKNLDITTDKKGSQHFQLVF